MAQQQQTPKSEQQSMMFKQFQDLGLSEVERNKEGIGSNASNQNQSRRAFPVSLGYYYLHFFRFHGRIASYLSISI